MTGLHDILRLVFSDSVSCNWALHIIYSYRHPICEADDLVSSLRFIRETISFFILWSVSSRRRVLRWFSFLGSFCLIPVFNSLHTFTVLCFLRLSCNMYDVYTILFRSRQSTTPRRIVFFCFLEKLLVDICSNIILIQKVYNKVDGYIIFLTVIIINMIQIARSENVVGYVLASTTKRM